MTVCAGRDLPWRGARGPQGYGLLVAILTIAVFMLSQAVSAAVAAPPDCSNESLRSELDSIALPDCRAYEMVTPPYKEGYQLYPLGYSNNGERVILYTLANLAGTVGAGEAVLLGNLYADERTPAGWKLSPLNPPSAEFRAQRALAVEAESGEILWEQSLQGSSSLDLYTRSAAGSLSRVGPLDPPEGFDRVVATSIDFRHIVSEARVTANDWPFDKTVGSVGSIYEYSGTEDPAPILIGVEGEKGSSQLIGLCGTELGGGPEASKYNAISRLGETIFFTVTPVGRFGCEAAAPPKGEIYARVNGSLTSPERATTVHISASECSCGEESGKNFEGASENGQKIFFTSTQKLTNEAGAVDGTASGDADKGSGCAGMRAGKGGCNLYEYDFSAEPGQRLRVVSEGGEVLGVSAIAEDGQRVYYVSRNALHDAGTNEFGKAPQNEQPNLYVYDTASSETHFIVTLRSPSDELMWQRAFMHPTNLAGEGGRFLLFASRASGLTPDDQTSQTQLFEYDAVSGELVRVTKGEDGYNEDGNGVAFGVEPSSIWLNKNTLGHGSDLKVRTNNGNLATDGKTVVFETQGQLSARATSAQQRCTSIYEFHTNGVLSAGTVSLLSDGRDVQLYKGVLCGPEFQKMDANGDNVLFFTADPLLPQDTDGVQEDIYDARVDGGIAPTSVAGLCNGGSCADGVTQGPTTIAPESTNEHGEAKLQPPPTRAAKNKPRKRKTGKRKSHIRKRRARKSSVRGGSDRRPRIKGKVG